MVGNQIISLQTTIFWSEPCNVVSELHDVSVIKEEGISFAVSKNYLVAFCELATLFLRITEPDKTQTSCNPLTCGCTHLSISQSALVLQIKLSSVNYEGEEGLIKHRHICTQGKSVAVSEYFGRKKFKCHHLDSSHPTCQSIIKNLRNVFL